MKIGIIGAGNIGANAAKLFIKAGHEIAIANSRGVETLRNLVEELGENARAASIEEAANFGEVVFIAVPFGRYETLPAEAFRGKIVIDAGNYYPQRDGNFAEIDAGKRLRASLSPRIFTERVTLKALTRFILYIWRSRAIRVCRSKNAAQFSSRATIRKPKPSPRF